MHAEMTADEIRRQIDEIEAQKAELSRAMEAKAHEERHALAQEITALIAGRGYGMDEILPLLATPSTRRRSRGTAAETREYPRYVDPQDASHVYVRGPLPGWMKDQMTAAGLDPARAEDRALFKARHLEPLPPDHG